MPKTLNGPTVNQPTEGVLAQPSQIRTYRPSYRGLFTGNLFRSFQPEVKCKRIEIMGKKKISNTADQQGVVAK